MLTGKYYFVFIYNQMTWHVNVLYSFFKCSQKTGPVKLVGGSVPPTIAAFQTGYVVMDETIVGITLMRRSRIVPLVIQPVTFSVITKGIPLDILHWCYQNNIYFNTWPLWSDTTLKRRWKMLR